MRLREAKTLLFNGNKEGAYYLTGLAVECALKACIAKNTNRHDFPPDREVLKDIYTHTLIKLVGAAKLQAALNAEAQKNGAFRNNWDVVKDWNVNSRNVVGGLNASDLYRAVAGNNGVMRWLRQRW